jgi:hypothetical protein
MSALVRESERHLVDEIEAALVANQWVVHREVWFAVYADLTEKQRRRVDLLAMPPAGPLRDAFMCLAIEAKNYASLEEIRVAKRQAISAMHGYDFQHGDGAKSRRGRPTRRPGIALIVTTASWDNGRQVFSHGEDAGALSVIERDLWEHGCGILTGPPSDPTFTSNSGGVPGGKTWRLFGGHR